MVIFPRDLSYKILSRNVSQITILERTIMATIINRKFQTDPLQYLENDIYVLD